MPTSVSVAVIVSTPLYNLPYGGGIILNFTGTYVQPAGNSIVIDFYN